MTFAFGVMTFRRCTHVYRLLAPGNISTKSQNKIQKRRNTKHEIHLHSDTLHNCMQLFDTPGKDDLHKVNCFFGFGKGFDLSLCYGTTHKLPFAVKIQIPISYDWEGEHARQGSGSIIHLLDSVKVMHMIIIRIIQTNICPCFYPCLEYDSLVFFLFYGSPTTHRFLCRLFPPSAFLTTPSKSIRRLFLFPGRFSLPGLFPHYRLPFPCWSATVSLPPSWSKLPEPSANHKTQNSPMREIGLRTGVHTHVLVHCHNWNILSYGLKM